MNGGRELPSSLVEGVVVLLTVEIDAEECRSDWFRASNKHASPMAVVKS